MSNLESEIIEQKNNNYQDEINIKSYFQIILRNKYLVFIITFLATTIGIIHTSYKTPIYQGSFQIVVQDKNRNQRTNAIKANIDQTIFKSLVNNKNNNLTQEFILKSPSVLKPVYNFALKKYNSRDQNIDKLTYQKWIKTTLDIGFEEGTQILNISFIDSDKTFIMDTLNLIREKYQDYSRSDKEKEMTKTILYLESQQKLVKEKTLNSLKELNEFSIENGLGDFDGFMALNDKSFKTLNELQDSENIMQDTGKRFAAQFILLEKYEAEYLDLSSKLKPKSRILKELKAKIDNIRSSLKRPNAIILKYRELVKEAKRNELLLNKIENELTINRLMKAKQLEPWQLISEPTLNQRKVSPRMIPSTLIALSFSLFFGSIIVIFKEKKSGLIYEFYDFINLISCPYLDTIYSKNKNLSEKIIRVLINEIIEENYQGNKNIKFGLLDLRDRSQNYKKHNFNFSDIAQSEYLDIDNQEKINNFNYLIFLISPGEITTNNILLINKYSKIYKNKVLGWIFINNESNL